MSIVDPSKNFHLRLHHYIGYAQSCPELDQLDSITRDLINTSFYQTPYQDRVYNIDRPYE